MAKEDAMIVEEFSKIAVSHLKEVIAVLPVLIPQTKEDKALFIKGAEKMSEIVYQLEHAESIRDIGRNIDIQKVVRDFDSESIKTLNARINKSARESVVKLNDLMDNLSQEE